MKKHIFRLLALATVFAVLAAGGLVLHTKSTIQEIFKLNQVRKSQGYYLSEFEWQMLACAHYLDTGRFVRALGLLEGIRDSLRHPESLARAPDTGDSLERLRFYQSLQHPETGAFMRDGTLPLFTFFGPTANMISLIEELSDEAGQPFELRHPLAFLDEIDSPDHLVAMLDEASRVGWIGAQFKTSYVCIAELGSLAAMCERLGLHSFSPEWKKALHDWFYENQDPKTGLWGPRSRSDGHLLHGGSLTESERVIKLFVDRQGNVLHPGYPLRHVDALIASSLARLDTPMPGDLDELHEWILARDHGTRFITRYLWPHASPETRQAARSLMEDFMRLRFERYFVAGDGAFSLYPDADAADLDGTGEAIGMYRYLGVLDSSMQQRLWGSYPELVQDLGTSSLDRFDATAFDRIGRYPDVNSIRAYATPPGEDMLQGVSLVYYPKETGVPDAVQLLGDVRTWLERTPQQMGNWVTRDSILDKLGNVGSPPVPSFSGPPVGILDDMLGTHGQVVLVGFDLLQVPRCMATFRLSP